MVVFEVAAVEDLLDLLNALSEEAARPPVLSSAALAELSFGLTAFADHVAEFKAPEADDFLRTPIKWVSQRQAVHAEELLGAVHACMTDALAAKAAQHTVKVARFFWLMGLLIIGLAELLKLLDEVGGLAALAVAAACHLVVVGDGRGLFLVDGPLGVLDLERQLRRYLLQELLNN